MIVRYTLTVYLEQTIEADEDPQGYLTQASKSHLERDVIAAIRTLDKHADCEVIDAVLVNE